MFQCDQHPYNNSQSLQCAQCVLPPEHQDQHEGLIDIDQMIYIANSLIESQPQSQPLFDVQALWKQIEQILFDSQEKAQTYVKEAYILLKSQVSHHFQLFINENDQQRQDTLKYNQAHKDVKNSLLKLNNQPQIPQYIQSITELNEAIESLRKCDNKQHINKLQSFQIKFIDSLNTQLNDFNINLNTVGQSKRLEFEQISKNSEMDNTIRSQVVSRSNTITSSFKKKLNESVNQVVQKQLRCNLATDYYLTSVICCVTLVIVGTQDGSILLYDNESWEEVQRLRPHDNQIKILCKQSEEQIFIASGSLDKTIIVYKREFNEDTAQFFLSQHTQLNGHHGAVLDMIMIDSIKHKQFKKINILVSSSSDNTVRIWNYLTGDALMNFSGHRMDVHALAFSQQLNVICSGSNDKTIMVWDALCYKACRPLQKMTGHTDSVLGLTILKEKQSVVVSCGSDKTIKMWDLKKGSILRSLAIGIFMARIVYVQTGLLAVIGLDQNIDIWDYNISTQVHQLKGTSKIQSIFVDDGNVYSVEDKNINLYF